MILKVRIDKNEFEWVWVSTSEDEWVQVRINQNGTKKVYIDLKTSQNSPKLMWNIRIGKSEYEWVWVSTSEYKWGWMEMEI